MSHARTLDGGGVERALLRLARGWLADGRRVTLMVGDAGGPLSAELPAGVDLIELGRRTYRAQFALPGIVARAAPDILFCPGNYYTGIAAWTRVRLGRGCPPIVAKMSNALVRNDLGRVAAAGSRAWLGLHPRFLDAVVAMTPATAEAARVATGLPQERIAVIANPPATQLPGTAMPTLPETRFVLGVGRLVVQKRWDRLIAAMPEVADRTVACVILGEGEARPALEAQIRQLGLKDRVHLPGHVGDPLPVLARAALSVLPSDYEGVPGVLRESLSVGTPVVASRSSLAVAEIVGSPALGTIVPVGDHAGLVAAIDRWLAPGALRPAPVPPPGADSAARYLALFDALVSRA